MIILTRWSLSLLLCVGAEVGSWAVLGEMGVITSAGGGLHWHHSRTPVVGLTRGGGTERALLGLGANLLGEDSEVDIAVMAALVGMGVQAGGPQALVAGVGGELSHQVPCGQGSGSIN